MRGRAELVCFGDPDQTSNLPEDVRAAILEMALEHSEPSLRELAARFTDSRGYFVSEASVYRLLKSHNLITSPAFIVMKAAKAFTDTLELALSASGCDHVSVRRKPCLLSDNGSSYISGELADWLGEQEMQHVRGAPYHPQTQGKIERWHQALEHRRLQHPKIAA